ncbi:LOW QUALITY PROTEIN: pulmonary surfactant-associated protein A-like [Leptosomus discolor]
MLFPQLFHKLLGVVFLLPCCAQGKPARIPPSPGFVHLPEEWLDEGFTPGFLQLVDNEMEDVIHQLEHQISRLEGVLLHLKKIITPSGGKIFANNRKKAAFHTTLKKCKEAGGSVATPRNPGEHDAILYFVKSFDTYTYLGIKESLIPGIVQFLDGTQLSYTNWHLNEPSVKGEKECVEMYTDGTWKNRSCSQNCLIVCHF